MKSVIRQFQDIIKKIQLEREKLGAHVSYSGNVVLKGEGGKPQISISAEDMDQLCEWWTSIKEEPEQPQ